MKKIKEEFDKTVDARGLENRQTDENSKASDSGSVNEKMKKILKVYCTGKLQNISDYSCHQGYCHTDHRRIFAELISAGKEAGKKPFLLSICIQVNAKLKSNSPSNSYTLDCY